MPYPIKELKYMDGLETLTIRGLNTRRMEAEARVKKSPLQTGGVPEHERLALLDSIINNKVHLHPPLVRSEQNKLFDSE